MANRRPLTAGLSVVPPGAPDAEAVKSFITQERQPDQTDGKQFSLDVDRSLEPLAASDDQRSTRKKKGKKSPVPVGLIPVTVRLKPEIAAALKRASLERQLAGEEVYTQQDLVEIALEPWLRSEGVL